MKYDWEGWLILGTLIVLKAVLIGLLITWDDSLIYVLSMGLSWLFPIALIAVLLIVGTTVTLLGRLLVPRYVRENWDRWWDNAVAWGGALLAVGITLLVAYTAFAMTVNAALEALS